MSTVLRNHFPFGSTQTAAHHDIYTSFDCVKLQLDTFNSEWYLYDAIWLFANKIRKWNAITLAHRPCTGAFAGRVHSNRCSHVFIIHLCSVARCMLFMPNNNVIFVIVRFCLHYETFANIAPRKCTANNDFVFGCFALFTCALQHKIYGKSKLFAFLIKITVFIWCLQSKSAIRYGR